MEYSDNGEDAPDAFLIEGVTDQVDGAYESDGYISTGLIPELPDEHTTAAEYEATAPYAPPNAVAYASVDRLSIIELHKMTPYEEKAAAAREHFFAAVGHLNDETGIEIDRVKRFKEALGFTRHADHIITDSNHDGEMHDALCEAITLAGGKPPERFLRHGAYSTDLGVVAVYRNIERNDTDETVEAVYAHEQGHATLGVHSSSSAKSTEVANAVVTLPFLEEGFSTWLACSYSEKTGLSDFGDSALSYALPEKYLLPGHFYNYGGVGWEVLFNTQPDLLEMVIDARNNKTLQRDIAGLLDIVQPGLYDRLSTVERYGNITSYASQTKWFRDSMHVVLKGAEVQLGDLGDICREGHGAQYIAKKLAAYEVQHNYRFRQG